MVIFQKPENALRRATELLEVSRKQDALETLHDVIKNRRARVWSKVHEQIMFKHLELCVELRKPHLAKDGLFQYRNMCQQVNAKSLEDVIQFFLEMAEKKADEARLKSQGLIEDVDDLDQAESPEKLLLSAVSGEGAQDRSDRTILSPWLRFLWESYRQCLELLRNNMQVETLYHRVAKQAFTFCLKFQRKTEFRKLCDNLRTHLSQIQKIQHHAHYALKLTNAETLAMHQETRLLQLDIAIQMELWQEAFKSIEDVYQLMQLSKRDVRAATKAMYYEKLALVFWKADSSLYHAAVLVRLFVLIKEQKRTVSVEEIQRYATRALLAVLSIASTGGSDLCRHIEMEEAFIENQRRLTTYINFSTSANQTPPPTRQSLLKEVVRLNIVQLALPIAQNVYKLYEEEFCPLSLANDALKELQEVVALEKLELAKYVTALKDVAAFKILKQVSQVYSTTTFAFLNKIIPFYNRTAIERLVVLCGKKSLIQMRVQHRTESVEFGPNNTTTTASGTEPTICSPGSFGGLSNQVAAAGSVAGSEPMRQHLQQMYQALAEAAIAVDEQRIAQLIKSIQEQATLYEFHKRDQHMALLRRKPMIEKYKEETERLRKDELARTEEEKKRENDERMRQSEARRQKEVLEREQMQKQKQQEALQKRIQQDRLDKMNPKLRKLMEELPEEERKDLDNDSMIQIQIGHIEKEKREHLAKLKQQERKWDYFVRAMHIEEIPLRQTEYEKWAVEDKKHWELYEDDRIKRAHVEHDILIKTVERAKLLHDADEIMIKIREARKGDFVKSLADWEKRLKDVRQQRLDERKEQRKQKRRADWEAEKEAERKKKEEEERQKIEAARKAHSGYPQRRGQDDGAEGGGAPTDTTWGRGVAAPGGPDRRRPQPVAPPEGEPSAPTDTTWGRGIAAPGGPDRRRPPPPVAAAAEGDPAAPQSNWRESQRPIAVAPPSDNVRQQQVGFPPRGVADKSDWRAHEPVQPQEERPKPLGAYRPPQRREAEIDDGNASGTAGGHKPWRGASAQQGQAPPPAGPAGAPAMMRRVAPAPANAWTPAPANPANAWRKP